jgi:hypothetical protein
MSPCGYEVDIVLMCPVIDLQLLLQGRIDQDNDLQERCHLDG